MQIMTLLIAVLAFTPLVMNTAYAHNPMCDNYCIRRGMGLDFSGNVYAVTTVISLLAIGIVFLARETRP